MAIYHAQTPACLTGNIFIVGNQNNGSTRRIEPFEILHDSLGSYTVQVSGGLISKKNIRVRAQGTGYSNPLAFTTGKRTSGIHEPVFQPQLGECLFANA